jgi:methionyl-tRNA formyltransferase
MVKKGKILYIGLNPQTLNIIGRDESFQLIGVGIMTDFFRFTLNPINLIFEAIYFLRSKNKFYFLEHILYYFWSVFSFLSSSIFSRYKETPKLLSNNRILLVNTENIENSVKFIKENKIDLIVMDSWSMLPEEIVNAPIFGTLNIHPSKLPKYRGALPTLWALKNGDTESAVTYILLNKAADSGNIINQHSFQIEKNDTTLDLEIKIAKIVETTLVGDINDYINGKISPTIQDNSQASYTAKYYEYLKIDWENEKAEDIYNKIKLYPFLEPGLYCYFYLGNQRIEIKKAEFIKNTVNIKAGQYTIKGLDVLFQAKDGIIKGRLFVDFSFNNSMNFFNSAFKFSGIGSE